MPSEPIVVDIIRPADLMVLKLKLINMKVDGQPGVIWRWKTNGEGPPVLVVEFPSQHIAEETFFEPAPGLPVCVRDGDGVLAQNLNDLAGGVTAELDGRLRQAIEAMDLVLPAAPLVEKVTQSPQEWQARDANAAELCKIRQRTATELQIARSVDPVLPDPPVGARIAGHSQLVYLVNPDDSIPGSLAGLLEWSRTGKRIPCLSPAATTGWPASSHAEPRDDETTHIEAPYRLYLSPDEQGCWVHAVELKPAAVDRVGAIRRELWHTRLAVKLDDYLVDGKYKYQNLSADPRHADYRVIEELAADELAGQRTVRAIWSPDYNADQVLPKDGSGQLLKNPFRMSLTPEDRNQIVHLTSDRDLEEGSYKEIQVGRLMLSALGAWLDLGADFGPSLPKLAQNPTEAGRLTIEEWRHRAAMGRDTYVRVVYQGTLFPFGHRASLVKITERKVQPSPSSGPVAYLRQRIYLIVREPERSYAARDFPFQSIRITTQVTPPLDDPESSKLGSHLGPGGGEVEAKDAFWPRVGSRDFLFHCVATDKDGVVCEFSTPLVFMTTNVDRPPAFTAYNKNTTDLLKTRRRLVLGGQALAFAPGDAQEKAVLAAHQVELNARQPPPDRDVKPHYEPHMVEASVGIPALMHLLGSGLGEKVDVQYYRGTYPDEAANRSFADVFVELIDPVTRARKPYEVDFSDTRRAGGLMRPEMAVSAVSRKYGLVAGNVDAFAVGSSPPTFKPSEFFPDVKLLGDLSLKDLVQDAELTTAEGASCVPVVSTTTTPDGQATTSLAWTTTRFNTVPPFEPNGTTLTINTAVTQSKEAAAQFTTSGTLSGFTLNFGGFIIVPVTSLTFIAGSGQKPHVSAEFGELAFAPPLQFLKNLLDKIPKSGFADPPSVDVNDQRALVSYSMGLPNLELGLFALRDLSIYAGLTLPFAGQAMQVEFRFAERHHPFHVAYSIFSGGGFLGLLLQSSGVQQLEAQLEFCGELSLDIGVASGGVYVMAGIYFKWALTGADQLSGYVRCGGELEVLGLISVSVEFYMSLGYELKQIVGRASMVVEVEVLFFSVDVTLSVERRFQGSDPTFSQAVDEGDWGRYWAAFAAD
jgi:hypothetical protein